MKRSDKNIVVLIPMTHVPEIGAENPYRKTGTDFWRVIHVV